MNSGKNHDVVAILDAGAQYGKVSLNFKPMSNDIASQFIIMSIMSRLIEFIPLCFCFYCHV